MKRLTLGLLAAGVLVAAEAPRDEASRKDLEKMQGDWAATSYVRDGQKLPDDDAQALFRTVKGNAYTVFRYSKVIGKGTFTLDATKKPRAIDALPAGGPPGAKPLPGIYEWDGDGYKVCFAPPGQDRPTTFTAAAGSGHTLTVWVREKK
jgi:uncharacterized protein (TIGR03067 family)